MNNESGVGSHCHTLDHHETTAPAVLTFGEQQIFPIAWHDVRYYQLIGQRDKDQRELVAGFGQYF